MTKQIVALEQIQLNASVNLDDVVTVFISRYETDCHNLFGEIQSGLKANKKKLADLEDAALAKIREDFVKPDSVICHDLLIVTTQSFGDVTINWALSTAQLTITLSTAASSNCKLIHYAGKQSTEHSFAIQVNLHEHFVGAFKRLTEEGNKLREELMAVNAKLQQIDRKARQVKGFIAERKLADAGMMDLLENPELLQLVQLSQ